MPSRCLVSQRALLTVSSSGVSVSGSGSRKRGSWFTALPRGQQLDPVTSRGAFQLHGTFSLPCPPSSGLMPSHISHLSGGPNFSGKLSLNTQPWPGEESTLVFPRLPCDPASRHFLIMGKSRTLELGCMGSSPGSATCWFCDLGQVTEPPCASVSSLATWKPISRDRGVSIYLKQGLAPSLGYWCRSSCPSWA